MRTVIQVSVLVTTLLAIGFFVVVRKMLYLNATVLRLRKSSGQNAWSSYAQEHYIDRVKSLSPPKYASNLPRQAQQFASIPCMFQAEFNKTSILSRLERKWSTNELVPKASETNLTLWHRNLSSQMLQGFQSTCFNRRDPRGKAITLNYAVLLPPSYGLRGDEARYPTIYLLHARDGAFTEEAPRDIRPNVADIMVDFSAAMSVGLIPAAIVVVPFSKPCSLWTDYSGERALTVALALFLSVGSQCGD